MVPSSVHMAEEENRLPAASAQGVVFQIGSRNSSNPGALQPVGGARLRDKSGNARHTTGTGGVSNFRVSASEPRAVVGNNHDYTEGVDNALSSCTTAQFTHISLGAGLRELFHISFPAFSS